VVDDGSTDGTAEMVESFGGTVRLIRQANRGPAAARNTGYRESRGEFIHFFDSDDIALPNKHEVQLRALQKNGADIAFGPWVKGKIGVASFEAENHVLQQAGLPEGDLVKALLTHWSIVPHACIFRRSIVEKVGGFPEELFGTEDQLMFLRCLLAGAQVVHSPDTLELYRTNDPCKITSANNAAQVRHQREWARFLVMAHDECLKHGIDPVTWFGYRQRIWSALDDLTRDHSDPQDLIRPLTALLGDCLPAWCYRLNRWKQRIRGGLQYRLTGGRANSSFRSSPLSQTQVLLIAEWERKMQITTRNGRAVEER